MRFRDDAGKAKGRARVDFRDRRVHEEWVHSPRRSATFLLCVTMLALLTEGCAWIHPTKITQRPPNSQFPSPTSPHAPSARTPASTPNQSGTKGVFYRITHPLAGFHLFKKKVMPPKAVPLRRIGIIRTLSQDGTYVIVELEPGVLVTPGADLLVTATGGEPAHLKAGDIQPPYFAADIVSGKPEQGDLVQQ